MKKRRTLFIILLIALAILFFYLIDLGGIRTVTHGKLNEFIPGYNKPETIDVP